MAQIIGLPKLSPTMEEGVLVKWNKKEGDKVSPGDLVAEVETDKANMDFNIEDEGVLLKLLAQEGATVKLGAPVLIIGKAGEDVSALVAQAAGGAAKTAAAPQPKADVKPTPAPAAAPKAEPKPAPSPKQDDKKSPTPTATPAAGTKLLASPLAKSLAIELGVDIRNVTGSGPGGRIIERDVRATAQGGSNGHAPPAEPPEAEPDAKPSPETAIAVRRPQAADHDTDYTDTPASNMRKRIAARLTEAKRDVPHFYLMRTLDAAPLLGFRERLNALLGDRGKVSVNDLVIKAVALALRRVPECNAAWIDDGIRTFHRVHVGVAVALPEGLVTPVIRDADQKGIGSIAAEVRDLAARAKSRQLKAHEITGSTFTVSNLGMLGIERFTAILNPPEAGILAIGATIDAPVVRNGAVVVGKTLTVTMSCDHRAIDGALGARWLAAFVDLAEHPESLAL
ncbi:MAG TPA: pyruvate dehydrogenase complex dihydrolipoamide acetyltransferase [Kofleriaceae bacterium]|jgi:pyruvate dehydrogenase E2 component (dihydrolipoamide acetyltransferase)|nr:pyruvate dehydrogenase complex dihydrolipoamide acetyltransferase [Kofleriaceae bacterium]